VKGYPPTRPPNLWAHARQAAPRSRDHVAYDTNMTQPLKARSGRKTISQSGERMKQRAIRMTDAEWEKCLRLGGSGWLREQIRGAKS